ncbi:MAG TPA: hypothetical protein VIG24_15745 [Acidimicrobiia bacterium]
MVVSLKHSFTSAKSDGPDNTLVQPSSWNAEHTLTQATARILGRTTAGTGATEELSVGANLLLSAGSLALVASPSFTGLTLTGTGAMRVPAGTSAQRPSPATGDLRYNSDLTRFEGYSGGEWVPISNRSSVSPHDFGAAGDRTVTDDSAAVQSWLEHLRDNEPVEGRVLAMHRLDTQVAVTVSGAADSGYTDNAANLAIQGIGQIMSGFFVNNAVGGLKISPILLTAPEEANEKNHVIDIRSLHMEPMAPDSGVPLELLRTPGGNQGHPSLILRDIYVGAEKLSDTAYFSNGIVAIGSFHADITDLTLRNLGGSLKWDAALDISGSYNPMIRNFNYRGRAKSGVLTFEQAGATHGVKMDNLSEGVSAEAFRMTDSVINGVDYGIDITNSQNEPLLYINNVHINAGVAAIRLNGVCRGAVSNSLIHQHYQDALGIQLIAASNIVITGNSFRMDGSATTGAGRHISLNPTVAGGVRNIQIYANNYAARMFDPTQAPIYVGQHCENIYIEIPENFTNRDLVTYAGIDTIDTFVEVHPDATNVTIRQGQNIRVINGTTVGVTESRIHDSGTPATNDVLHRMEYKGRNDANELVTYAKVEVVNRDVADGTEDADVMWKIMDQGTEQQALRLFKTSTGDESYALLLFLEAGSVKTVKRVKQGAADSGGTGSRMLIVDN